MRTILIVMILACAGCAKVQYLDQAFALKAYSDEKDAQHAYVQRQDGLFEKMVYQSRQREAFDAYRNKKEFVSAFGEPILCRPLGDLEECLYRRIVKPSESPRIYLYFNARGELVRWHGGAA